MHRSCRWPGRAPIEKALGCGRAYRARYRRPGAVLYEPGTRICAGINGVWVFDGRTTLVSGEQLPLSLSSQRASRLGLAPPSAHTLLKEQPERGFQNADAVV